MFTALISLPLLEKQHAQHQLQAYPALFEVIYILLNQYDKFQHSKLELILEYHLIGL
jgi:hypothetical protein